MNKRIQQFLWPKASKRFLFRLMIVSLIAFCVFKFVLIPIRISGSSMAPAYTNGGFNFCFKLRYFFRDPLRFDVVGIRMAGEKVILLKRIIGLENEIIEIRNGNLYIDGKPMPESHLIFESDWNLPPRTVKPGYVYVIGDNRSVPMHTHKFGQVKTDRIAGAPLW